MIALLLAASPAIALVLVVLIVVVVGIPARAIDRGTEEPSAYSRGRAGAAAPRSIGPPPRPERNRRRPDA
jgi:hypothetical protein